jgi:DNA (cytosine-5)-methyltransferase 1
MNHAHVRARTLRWAIVDLVGCSGRTPIDTASVLTAENRKRAKYLLRAGLYDLPNARRPHCQRDAHKYKSMYGRLWWNRPAQTITTGFGSPGQGRYLHPSELRTLTPHEAARVQFFPDWYDFSNIRHQRHLARAIGNAAPPKLAFAMALHLLSLGRVGRSKSISPDSRSGRSAAMAIAAAR